MKHLILASTLALTGAFGITGCAVTSGQSSVGQYVDDATITARVNTRFAKDPVVSALRVQVETLKGVVQLSGFVSSQAVKQRAEEIARGVPDVRAVRNDLIVQPPSR